MNRCSRCKVNIKDDAVMCPLCRGVLERGDNGEGQPFDLSGHASHSVMYPNVEPAMKRMRMVTRTTIFLSVIVECVAVLVNYLTYDGVKWSLISAVALAYGCFTLIYSVKKNKSHQRKMVVQLVMALFMILAIDAALGFRGWSISLGIPGAIILMDIGIFVLMLVNSKNWQNYIMSQVWMLIISIVCAIPVFQGMVDFPLISIIAVVLSVLFLAGSVVFGDKKAESELRRRFHV